MVKNAILIFLFTCSTVYGQQILTTTIESDYLENSRDVRIYIPKSYELDSVKSYPLAIVFDAEFLFDIYVGNSVLFASKDKAPEQIVVGINMAETRKNDTYFNINTGQLNPTNQAFYEFIRDEVTFYMESNYRTSPFISLIGTGTSANLISQFLKESKPIFNAYVCINPIFSDFIRQQMQNFALERYGKEDNTFYLYTNNSNTFSPKRQTLINQVQTFLGNYEIENFNIVNDYITTKSSISTIGEAIPRAITKVFELYSPISKDEFDTKIKNLSPEDAIAYLENKYIEIEFLFGSNLGIREQDVFAIESIIIDKENGDYLRDFGKMILKLFPSSPLGDYYIGRYYEEGNMIKKALKHYKIGYGKMDPSDPNADKFYENILRLRGQ
ncbi:MAG: alpha/beta hydrolase-fold protein [Polaribacter sp.]